MNHDVFISYSSKNSAAALAICHELEDNGIKCWMAPRDIPVGAKYASVITDAIVSSKVVVLIFSNYAACSVWVESEINIAFSNRKIIIPYKIDTTKYEDFKEFYLLLNNRHWIDAYPDFKTRFKELVETVAQTLGKTNPENNIDADVDLDQQFSKGTLIIKTDLDCRVFNYGEEIGVAKAGEYTKFELPLGDNELKYVGLESEEDCYEEQIVITDNYCKLVKVTLFDKYKARKTKEENEYLLSLPDDEFDEFVENGKYGFKLKSESRTVIPFIYDFACVFKEGLACVRLNGKYGFINKMGDNIIPLQFDYAMSYSEGLSGVGLNGKCGFIDKRGEEVVPFEFDYTGSFSEGLAMVRKNRKCGYIDKAGKEIVSLKYDMAGDFCGGLAWVELNGKCGFINKVGVEVVSLRYDYVDYFSEGLAKVNIGGYYDTENGEYIFMDGKWGYIDKSGEEIIPLKYDLARDFNEGLAEVKLAGKWGFINKMGEEITPLKYDYIGFFHESMVMVELNGKYGFVDKTGKEVIPLKYYHVDDFCKGKAKVYLDGESFYIDKNGNRVDE